MEKKQNWYVNQRKYHFIYKTINLVNSKYYLGMHSTDNLDDGYIGSGTRLWHSIKKYGKENFSIEILEFLPDRESLKKREAEIVNEEKLIDPLCMNLTLGGGDGWDWINKNKSLEERSRVGKLGGYANFTCEQRSQFATQNLSGAFTKAYWQDKKRISAFKDRNHSDETRQLMRESHAKNPSIGIKNSQYGTCWITDGNFSRKIKVTDLQQWIDLGWRKGRT